VEPFSATLGAEPTVDKAMVSPRTAVTVAAWKVEAAILEAVLGFKMWVFHQVPFNSIGGPVMIYQLASKSAQAGAETFLHLMALISVGLGVMNLLPIPILDGFHLVAAFWEGVRKRPIPVRAREVANLVGLAMLIALMVVAFTNDLTR
jgi:regulator of sigma E protease